MTEAGPRGGGGSAFDAIVLGAGVAGLTAARELARSGRSVCVVDRDEACGGSHRSVSIDGASFDVGSVFFEEGSALFDVFPEARTGLVSVVRRQQRVTPQGTVMHYPLAPREVLAWPKPVLALAGLSLATRRLTPGRAATVEAACLRELGAVIYRRSGLAAYIERLAGVPARELDRSFFDQRMGFVRRMGRPASLVRFTWHGLRDETPWRRARMPMLVRPPGGFEVTYGAIQGALEGEGVTFVLSSPLCRIDRRGTWFAVTAGGECLTAPLVVGAVPLDVLSRAALRRPAGVTSRDLLTLFIRAYGKAAFPANVLYNFHWAGRWKRLTMYSDFFGAPEGTCHFSVEATFGKDEEPSLDREFADFARQASTLGLFGGKLELLGHAVTPDAYPVQLLGAAREREDTLRALREVGIVTVGRQGRFHYLPTASGVVEDAKARVAPLSARGS